MYSTDDERTTTSAATLTVSAPDPATAAQPEPDRWYFRLNGQDRGPVAWDVLEGLARNGDLKPSDLVRRTDDDRWVPASHARGGDPAARPSRTIEPAIAHRLATALAADAANQAVAAPARPFRRSTGASTSQPAAATGRAGASRPGQHAGTALLALGLSLVGLFALALPLGMLSVYLGGRSAAALRRGPWGAAFLVAVAAVLAGTVDVGVSLWVIGGRLAHLHGQFAGLGQ